MNLNIGERVSNFAISIQFFLQLSIILVAIRAMGYLGKRFLGQPQVVCEMITGVLLGPSFFGHFFPEAFAAAFPKETIPVIYSVAQVGLVLYMFLIGNEFRTDIIRRKLKSAVSVSISGILFPFILAAGLAAFVITGEPYFTEGVATWQRWLFLGAAISITAFPMLARIIYEAKISGTSMGTISLAAGSIDDAAAWCILAVVLATFANDPKIAYLAIGGGLAYAIFTMTAVRAMFAKVAAMVEARREKNKRYEMPGFVFGLVLMALMFAAYVTDAVGIYAVFGAFILGAAMPKGKFAEELQHKIEPLTTNLLLPLFFIIAGLSTKISLLFESGGMGVMAAILVCSIAGKFIACSVSAKLTGESTHSALCIGSLMNARGLMELILLNIGLERGIITPNLYTALVMMAIVTTLMATPIFNFFYRRMPKEEQVTQFAEEPHQEFKKAV